MTNIDLIIKEIGELKKDRVIICIDGPSAAGKTSLAEAISKSLDATVFHIDDFFVPFEQKKNNPVFSEIGNNYDFERFENEIILPIKNGEKVVFRRFCCKSQTLLPTETIEPKRVVIIEGVYSAHPRFADIFDIKYFLDIDKKTQKNRIEERNGSSADRFFNEWIPLEDAYFEKFDVRKSCCLL